MNSHHIRFQTLIRKFKNGIKDTIDKKKIIENYTYQLSCDEILSSSDIIYKKKITSDTSESCNIYTLQDLYEYYFIDEKKSDTIKIKHMISTFDPPSDILFSFSPNEQNYMPNMTTANTNNTNTYLCEDDYNQYLGEDGILCNIYKCEYCDNDWVVMMYFINRLYPNFAAFNKIKIHSLFINSLPGSSLSAIHHFLYNSKINNVYNNIEWEWLGTINNNMTDPYNIKDSIEKNYVKNILHIFDNDTDIINNANFIINETLHRLGKLNFIYFDIYSGSDYIVNALLIIKLLSANSIAYIELKHPKQWTVQDINGILLYVLLFQELYLFQFDKNIQKNILICKNKKRIHTESLYKKLVLILMSNTIETYNLFSIKFITSNAEISKIVKELLDIKEKNIDVMSLNLSDLMYEISNVLEPNINTFL